MIATKSARAFTKKRAEELIEAIEIEISANEDQIDIDTEFPWWNRLDPSSSLRVDYQLWIPLSAKARAESVSGSIEIMERNNDLCRLGKPMCCHSTHSKNGINTPKQGGD